MAEEWILYGMDWNDPMRIRTWQELKSWVDEIGFLPLFRNEIPGFSVEEHTCARYWWSGNREQDPWEWREIIAGTGEMAYGKFFGGKAGFVSREWFPVLANYRRDGYDFDTLWEEGFAASRAKKIMDCVLEAGEISFTDLKTRAGFGKGGEKNYPGILTSLQMQTYLTVMDFRRKLSRAGREYGMPISITCTPEHLWGEDLMEKAYQEDPQVSFARVLEQVHQNFPWAQEEQLKKVLK